jgi:hypothetical protein
MYTIRTRSKRPVKASGMVTRAEMKRGNERRRMTGRAIILDRVDMLVLV